MCTKNKHVKGLKELQLLLFVAYSFTGLHSGFRWKGRMTPQETLYLQEGGVLGLVYVQGKKKTSWYFGPSKLLVRGQKKKKKNTFVYHFNRSSSRAAQEMHQQVGISQVAVPGRQVD